MLSFDLAVTPHSVYNKAIKARNLTALAFLLLVLMLGGCTTDYQEEHRELYWKQQSGEISESEYEQKLKEEKGSQSWGGISGVHEDSELPVFIESWPGKDMKRNIDYY